MNGLSHIYKSLLQINYRKAVLLLSGIFSLFYLAGCSGLSKLPPGKRLYTGATVKLESQEPIKNEAALSTELASVITPKPNTSFFGMRPKLAIYNFVGTPKKEKGLRSFIRRTFGEPPVYYDSVSNKHITDLMVNRLNNSGYFHSTASYKENIKPKTVSVTYTAQVAKPYTISSITYPAGDSAAQVYRDIAASQENSLLKVGDIYNLANFSADRVRIDAALKNRGYFYFDPDYLLYKVDTTHNNYTVQVYPTIKPDTPEDALVSYKLGDIYIYTNYSLGRDSTDNIPPVRINGYQYFPDEESLKARHLLPSVFLEKNNTYNRRDHALTVSRLMSLGLFRYVDVKFSKSDSIRNALNAYLRLTPQRTQSLRAEVETVTKTNGFAGPGINIRYRHRNLMRGAEQLQLTLNASQESFSGNKNRNSSNVNETNTGNNNASGLNSLIFGAQAQLDVPRFITPFNLTNLRSEFVPKTRFTLGFTFMDRRNFFQMLGYNATYGYVWRPKPRITHELTPINIQYSQLSNVDTIFQRRLDNSLYLRQTFQNQFIAGSIYNFTYNTQNQQQHKTDFYFNGNIDVSGNLLNLFTSKIQKQEVNPNTVLKQAYSQYSRLTLETRFYQNLTKGTRLATRMIIGAGIPYGNSAALPYIKQYFIGGANSIRAYRPRELGPGTYVDTTTTGSGYFDQTGDIKFEANAELRFNLIPYLKGAVFVDAGNIWLAKGNPERPNGEFKFNRAVSQLAIGTGAGLRVDAEFFVLRLDLGIPLRDPYQSPSYVLRVPPNRKSMVLHIAIGYPF
ncbi:BamA/TamA family outer membrane protein [Adhaeribacter aquaticus]|uniref:translocation and assembly module lipoprotein TamL n=1 Tax=Adhaeribacter aquaticus TaxID=299567 RepID=UPI00040CEBB3|nr:BamA/TamA family outer membrane protein [Adhaeribacter aquaticus]